MVQEVVETAADKHIHHHHPSTSGAQRGGEVAHASPARKEHQDVGARPVKKATPLGHLIDGEHVNDIGDPDGEIRAKHRRRR